MRLIDVLRDERGFIHKKIFGGIKGAIGGVVSGLTRGQLPTPASLIRGGLGGFFGGGAPPGLTRVPPPTPILVNPRRAPVTISTPRPTPSRTLTARVTPTSQAQKALALQLKFPDVGEVITTIGGALGIGGNGNGNGCVQKPCPPGLVWDPVKCFCIFPGSPAGGVGEALMGQFGAALEPFFFTINQRRCLPGMILGKDKLCYNVGAISNKERLWPKGPAPLLTGGEMSAIRKAAGAAKKFQRAGGRMRAIGQTFAGPTARRAPKRRVAAPRTVKVLESGPGSVQL